MSWQTTLYLLPGILLGLTVHEYSHAFCAWKLGDNTARDLGRLTLNPIKHIDIIGFIFIIIAGFGWAKPVQFNPANLKRPRLDKALIAAAGPLSNFVLGIILVFSMRGFTFLFYNGYISPDSVAAEHVYYILFYGATINFGLFIFNLLPIPPLDGSHIVFSTLNLKPEIENIIRNVGMQLLLVIIIVQKYVDVTIIPIGKIVMSLTSFFLGLDLSAI